MHCRPRIEMRTSLAAGMFMLCTATGGWADRLAVEAEADSNLKHFTRVDLHVFAGSKPIRDSDFKFLRSIGVKYILEVKFLPDLTGRERSQAAKYGLKFYSVPMNASPVSPSVRHVNEALRIIRAHQPIYIHCVLGRDRTGLLAGLYKIYFEGLPKEDAYRIMKSEGFRSTFFVHGLKVYFDKHSTPPTALAAQTKRRRR